MRNWSQNCKVSVFGHWEILLLFASLVRDFLEEKKLVFMRTIIRERKKVRKGISGKSYLPFPLLLISIKS
jgi:hypothetical protein